MAVKQSARTCRLQQHGSRLIFAGGIDQRAIAKIFGEKVVERFHLRGMNQHDAALRCRAEFGERFRGAFARVQQFRINRRFRGWAHGSGGNSYIEIRGRDRRCLRRHRQPQILGCERLNAHVLNSDVLELFRGPRNRAIASRRTCGPAANAVAQFPKVRE